MSALGHTYRFTALNAAGVNVTLAKVRERRWKYDPANGLTFESAESTPSLNSTATTGTQNYVVGSTVDNSANKYEGGDFIFEVTAAASASGNVYLYLDKSTDGGTTWPTNGSGRRVATINFTASGTKAVSFSL